MRRAPRLDHVITLVAILSSFVLACTSGDVSLGSWGTGGGSGVESTDDGEDSTDDGNDGADETGEACDPPPPAAGPCNHAGEFGFYLAIPPEPVLGLDPTDVCPDLEDADNGVFWRMDAATPNVAFAVYRPTDSQGEWPEEGAEHPVIFFVPGNGQNVFTPPSDITPVDYGDPDNHLYWSTIEPLVQRGFVVFAAQPPSPTWAPDSRWALLACLMQWAQDTSEDGWEFAGEGHISAGAVLMGHSRGGAAAYLLTEDLMSGDNLPSSTEAVLATYEQCAAVTLGQYFRPAASETEPDADEPIFQTGAPPFLTILSSNDEDTRADSIRAFDARVPEQLVASSTDVAHLDESDEVWVTIYGPKHNTFGGIPNAGGGVGGDKAQAAGPYYVRRFLQWKIFHDQAARASILAMLDPEPDVADFPSELQSSTLWEADPGLADLDFFYRGCDGALPLPDLCVGQDPPPVGHERPLVFGAFTQGIAEDGAGRFVVDTMTRSSTPQCDGAITASTHGAPVTVTPADASGLAEVCIDGATSVLAGIGHGTYDAHLGDAMLVSWGGTYQNAPGGGVVVEWSLEQDGIPLAEVGTFTHLSIRLGNVIEDGTSTSCDAVPDEVTVEVELVSHSAVTSDPVTKSVTPAPLVEGMQYYHDPAQFETTTEACYSQQQARTIRIPLTDFCGEIGEGEPGVSVQSLSAVRLVFPPSTDPHRVLVDAIELTRDPTAVCSETCPQSSMAWNCEVGTFLALETSCAGEPTGQPAACDTGDVRQSMVSVPLVDEGESGEFGGWVVHTPAGWIANPTDPDEDELAAVLDLCSTACVLEWSDIRSWLPRASRRRFSSRRCEAATMSGRASRSPTRSRTVLGSSSMRISPATFARIAAMPSARTCARRDRAGRPRPPIRCTAASSGTSRLRG